MNLTSKEIILFGVGASRADIIDVIAAINAAAGRELNSCRGYLDDNEALWGTKQMGVPVLGGIERAREYTEALFIHAIGSDRHFRSKMNILKRAGVGPERYATLVHPAATCSPSAKMGHGCVLMPGARVSANVILGDGVILMHNSFVGHDTRVDHHTYFAPGAMSAGFNSIGPVCYLGMNCSLRENLSIGQGSIIGMAAVVLNNVEADTVLVGNPARILRRFPDPIVPSPALWPTNFLQG